MQHRFNGMALTSGGGVHLTDRQGIALRGKHVAGVFLMAQRGRYSNQYARFAKRRR